MNWLGRIKKSAIIYAFPFIALILALFAKETSGAAKNALYLSLDVVIPSLFPFFVLSRLTVPFLSSFKCPKFLKYIIEKLFRLPYYTIIIMILGYLSGYPTGAKLARDMFDEGIIDSHQASKIITVANNCSPLFLIGTIGAGFFKSIKIGFLLLLIHWLSGIIAAFITLNISASEHLKENSEKRAFPELKTKSKDKNHIFYLLPSAIEDAAILCIKVSGYIIFFAVLSELLSRAGVFSALSGITSMILTGKSSQGKIGELISAISKGILEITSGSQAISQLPNYSLNIKLALISLICGFAGFSVHTQIMGIMRGSKAKYKVLIRGKILHGMLAFILTLIITRISPMTVHVSNAAVLSLTDFSGIRIITISVLILSLIIAPYKSEKET
ncbi:MAG: hypothetical protein GX957_13025 [Clostridiaceae bacterium]|nr:hypothetical protein [Clostridiaceae bacterium]